MSDVDLLVTFLEIYRSGSLTAAAAARGLTQPAVSGQLRRLEQRLGEPLFIRTRQGVRPTARADELAQRIGPHLDHVLAALTAAADPGYHDTVRLGGASEVMTARVVPALVSLTRRGLRVRITLGLADELLAALSAGDLDLVVSAIRPVGATIAAVPLVDEEFVLVAPPSLARIVDPKLLDADPVKALAALPLVAYAEELPIIRRYWRGEFGQRPPNEVAMVVPDLRAVLAAVVAGVGASVLPRYLAEPAITAGSVEVLHRPEVLPLNTLYLATRAGEPPTPAAALVHRLLLRRARDWGSL